LRQLVSAGKVSVPETTKKHLEPFGLDAVAAQTGVAAGMIEEAAAILAEQPLVITTRGLLHSDDAQDTIETLAGLAMTTGGEFNCYALEANEEGADLLGVWPGGDGYARGGSSPYGDLKKGLGTEGILKGCADGSVKALWLVNAAPLTAWHSKRAVELALEKVEFLVYQGILEGEEMSYASVVLPMCGPAEADCSYTNLERRVQRVKQVLTPPGESKPAWRTFSEVGLRKSPATPLFNPREVMNLIADTYHMFAGVDYDKLPAEGLVLGR
jgi:predicted molibdopterin-dependent oxidoreductase YjgC